MLLKPSVVKRFKSLRVGAVNSAFEITLKVLPGKAVQLSGESGPEEVDMPGKTLRLGDDDDQRYEDGLPISNAGYGPCKKFTFQGDTSDYGCLGGVRWQNISY